MTGSAADNAGSRQAGHWTGRRRELWGLLCAAPIIVGFSVFSVGPMIASLFIGFTDWSTIRSPDWVGLRNFEQILTRDQLFAQSLRVTVTYAAVSVPLQLVLAFSLALLLNERVRGISIFRTLFYLPAVVPLIASSVLWLWMFTPESYGLLNAGFRLFGLSKSAWLSSSDTALPSLILMSLWSVGGLMLIFLAGLQGVPRHLYEAVEVDGGNAWHRLRHITLPMMTPTIFFNLVIAVIAAMQTFTQAFVMTEGGPNNATLFYVLYVYRKAFSELELGYASALAWVLFLIVAGFTAIAFRTSSMWVHYEISDR